MPIAAPTIAATAVLRTGGRGASRRRVWWWVTGSYAVDVMLVALFAGAGTVPWAIPAMHGLAAAAVSAASYALLHREVDARTADPYWVVPQAAAGIVVQLGGMLAAPVLSLVYLNVLFVVVAFGSLRMTWRQIAVTWLTASVGATAVVIAGGTRLAPAAPTPVELGLLALSYVSTIARCAFVGYQGSRLREELRRANDQLVAATLHIERLARQDDLTGLLNRRCIRALLEDHAALAARGLEDLAVALLDFDHFKRVNDRHGHAVGDEVLQTFGRIAVETLRVTDYVGRYGGEEFLCVLTCGSVAEAQAAMERVRGRVAAFDWKDSAPGLRVTVSIGIAVHEPGRTVPELLRQADGALYAAKAQGRDRVVLAA